MVVVSRRSTTVEAESPVAEDPATPGSVPRGSSVVFYDGVCALCNGSVRFIRKRDPQERYYFASLQSEFAHRTLPLHDCDPGELDTIYLLLHYGESDESVLSRSQAAFRILESLGHDELARLGLGIENLPSRRPLETAVPRRRQPRHLPRVKALGIEGHLRRRRKIERRRRELPRFRPERGHPGHPAAIDIGYRQD